MNSDNVTVVSGYWRVTNKYGGHDKYNEWFSNSLKINQRYIFFCDKEEQDYIQQFRHHSGKDLPTIYVPYSLNSFYSSQYLSPEWVHPVHVPSIEISSIWHEKIHLLKLAKDLDKDKTEFYVWIDAGICNFRKVLPPQYRLNVDKNALPHNKLCFSMVKEKYHNFSGGVLIIHKDVIDRIHDLYYNTLTNCKKIFNDWRCGSDQFIYTQMVKHFPRLFHRVATGYGQNLTYLYKLALQKEMNNNNSNKDKISESADESNKIAKI